MSGPEDGFPYNSIIRERDLFNCKETDIIDCDETNHLTVFDFIDEESMNKLNSQKPYVQNFEEIRETDLSNMTEMRETDMLDNREIKETDLCSDDTLEGEEEEDLQNESTPVTSEHSSYHHDNDGDSEQWHLDNAESVSVSTDSGFINDKMNLDLEFNHLSSAIKFQDLESDFFETDCETMDKSPTDECFETNHGETKEMVRFQDIESDFFETDCEGVDVNVHSDHRVNFQDIESDFFDDEEDMSPSSTLKRHSPKQVYFNNTTKQKCISDVDQQKEILSRLSINKDKRASMTNSLLRSTIEELERALGNSNSLLAKRDQKISNLRKRNSELKKSLTEELENSAQMKLILIEKEAVISEKETAISELQNEIEKLNDEISELRLYKFNNTQDFSFTCDPVNLQNAAETDLLGDQDTFLGDQGNVQQQNNQQTHSQESGKTETHSTCKSKCPHASRTQKQTPTASRDTSFEKSPVVSPTHVRSTSKTTDSPKSPSSSKSNNNPDNVSSSELHARLQMKFMRDAFFYYMIGFHSDEQINAILAILNYGDKRQDFVLEAHKLKQMGKKFNVSKVSTRGLTFVQNIENK